MTARDVMFIQKSNHGATTLVQATTEQHKWEVMVNYLNELEQAGHRFPRVTVLTKPQQVLCLGCGASVRWYMHDDRIDVHSDVAIDEGCWGSQMFLHDQP